MGKYFWVQLISSSKVGFSWITIKGLTQCPLKSDGDLNSLSSSLACGWRVFQQIQAQFCSPLPLWKAKIELWAQSLPQGQDLASCK